MKRTLRQIDQQLQAVTNVVGNSYSRINTEIVIDTLLSVSTEPELLRLIQYSNGDLNGWINATKDLLLLRNSIPTVSPPARRELFSYVTRAIRELRQILLS